MVKIVSKFDMDETSEDFFRTIGDVSEELDIPTHVLRFWESKFTDLKPLKRKGGHRYYKTKDIDFIKQIRELLHEQGYTIRGAQKFLKFSKKSGENSNLINSVETLKEAQEKTQENQQSLFGDYKSVKNPSKPEKVRDFIKELESIKDMLNSN